MKIDSEVLMGVSGGLIGEKIKSTRYRWDSQQRGSQAFVIFQWTESGAGIFEWRGKSYEVSAGKAFISIVPEKACYYYPGDVRAPWVFSWVNITGALAVQLWTKLREIYGPVLDLNRDSLLPILLKDLVLKNFERRWKNPREVSLSCYQFYLELVDELESPSKVGGKGLAWARASLLSEFRNGWVMKEVADRLGWSREHFSREYRRTFGVSPAAELRRYRFAEACRLLKSTSWTTEMIAVRSGFTNATQMGIYFQKNHQMTPVQYRMG